MLNEALKQKNVDFVWDSNIDKCIPNENSVSVVVDSKARSFDLCILASGSNSSLAEGHFQNRVHRPYGWGCLWTTFTLPDGMSSNILHQRCRNTNKMMGILPVRNLDGKYEAALYWSMKSKDIHNLDCLLYTSPSPRDQRGARMPSSA